MEFETVASKSVLVIYTGGTVGMLRGEGEGLRPVKGALAELFDAMIPLERSNNPLPEVTVTEFDVLVDSSDMGPVHWKTIAEMVAAEHDRYDGFVVIMGSDTMAYAASAVSFQLQNLASPVVFTGSIIPFASHASDARRNVFLSVQFAATQAVPEVVILFDDVVLRGCRAKKVDSESLHAFHSPNFPPLATLGSEIRVRRSLVRPYPKEGTVVALTKMDPAVTVIKVVPGLQLDGLVGMLRIAGGGLRGVIFELFGAGNAPVTNGGLIDAVKFAVRAGTVVCIASQCPRGAVMLTTYALGQVLLESGALGLGDMTVEAASMKLSYLLGQGLSSAEVKEEMLTNLRGEVTLDHGDVAERLPKNRIARSHTHSCL